MSNFPVEGLTFFLLIAVVVVIVPIFDLVFRVVKKAERERKIKKGK